MQYTIYIQADAIHQLVVPCICGAKTEEGVQLHMYYTCILITGVLHMYYENSWFDHESSWSDQKNLWSNHEFIV